uniref:Immunoglobulin domain-containing protein n=1 Tax=Laticauda laticaudata TaxID=8630 RepID=A0A8C5WXF9_LATLA
MNEEKVDERGKRGMTPEKKKCTDTITFINVINTRFIAARGGARISLSCSFGSLASWYKESEQDKYQEIMNSSRVHVTRNATAVTMQINKLQHTDSGIYHCMSQDLLKPTCGTELKIMGSRTYKQVQNHHNVKDAIILIQTILLVLFVSVPVFLTQGKVSEKCHEQVSEGAPSYSQLLSSRTVDSRYKDGLFLIFILESY